MTDFALYVVAGFIAQLIDGALGMAYGVTASSLLMGVGIPPAATSATVHAAECFTQGLPLCPTMRFEISTDSFSGDC